MRAITFAALAGLNSLVSSQLIDLDYVNALPDPTYTIIPDQKSQTVTYNQATAIASVVAEALHSPVPDPGEDSIDKRDLLEKRLADCATTDGTANIYHAKIDPAEDFLTDQKLQERALLALTPSTYTRVYQNLKKAAQANGYMGYTVMSEYNVQTCADKCTRTLGCQGFNTYFERSPSQVPAPGCRDPPGLANPFCVLWGGPVSPENALNEGQWRENFHVVITGSNGYVLTSSLDRLSSKAINAPLDCNNDDSYMGMRLLTDNAPFDPLRCAAICDATSRYNIDHPHDSTTAPRLCKFYNTYILNKNYISQGQVCSMYTQYWNPDVYAVNDGQYDGQGNHYTISSSVFFRNSTDVTTPVCPADIDTLKRNADAGAFCTSYNSYTAPATVTVTTTSTFQACAVPTQLARRDDSSGAVVEAVVAVYPSKVDDPEITGTVPALVTVPAQSLSIANIYASATSEAIADLGNGSAETASPPSSAVSPTSPAVSVTSSAAPVVTQPVESTASIERRAATTPQIFVGRDPREISSACSRIIDRSTATTTVQAPAIQTSYDNCAQAPEACQNGPGASIIAGSFTSATSNIDDVSYTLQLPFDICIYETCSKTVHPTTNGLITLDNFATSEYTNTDIPFGQFNPNAVLYAFWDDLYIFQGRRHFLSYTICGSAGRRTVTFDWRMGHFSAAADGPLFRFSAKFYEDKQGRVDLKYWSTTDSGASASVGIQGPPGRGGQKFSKYSFEQAIIRNGLGITFNPSANVFSPTAS